MTKTFLIADTHFFHENVIKYCNRPFKSIEEMNQTMTKNWNEMVDDNDIIYHLGDFTMVPYIEGLSYKDRYISIANKLLDRLNGKKYLIRGNHDPRKGIIEKCHFETTFRELELDGFLLTHRPKETDLINIHGHVHDKFPFWYLENDKNKFNVSADMIGFRPIELNILSEEMTTHLFRWGIDNQIKS